MTRIELQVQGSTDQYTVTVTKTDDSKVSVTCTCAAGQNFTLCKHRMNILQGDTSLLVADQNESYASARQLIESSGIMQEKSRLDAALAETGKELAVLKKEMDKLKKKDNAAKKAFAKALDTGA